MAVIRCKSCSAKVNEGASACPECGADPRTGESLLDWSRLAAPNSATMLAEAQRVRESWDAIAFSVIGGVWALFVWLVGSLTAAMIGLEGADPDPPRHRGLLVLMLTYVVVAGLAFWAAARAPSDPHSGAKLAVTAFVLGYVPPAAAALGWDLVEPSRLGYEVLVVLLGVLWTLGGWTLVVAATASRGRARRAGDAASGEAAPEPAPQVADPAEEGRLAQTTATSATSTRRGDHVNDDHDHQTPGTSLEPGVDAGSGTLEHHCSQCGSLIEGSHEFCQVCALEASGGELPPEGDPA